MLAPAASASEAILAIHIVAVMVAFGVTFTYPVFALIGNRDRHSMPTLHRLQQAIGRFVINPGLLVILLAGIYLASHDHQWSAFYVQWGLAAVVVLGGLEGAVVTRGEGRLAELAARDLAAAGAGEVAWSEEYGALRRRIGAIGALMDLIVVLTIFFMALRLGGS
ncbi:MAG: hypothetical protein M3Z27_07335 [Actinomycetota bacterium]|nr:hypothetical protein [Actinomycetota bacterium]